MENKENIIKQIYKKHKVKRYLTLLLGLFICAVSFNLFIFQIIMHLKPISHFVVLFNHILHAFSILFRNVIHL